ncbi:YlbF family regulator [Cohnella lubricantis]|uniref:YlbF family regulator n=2 Tax=Cohnella lubricantis TaxID=2163172 RepID=A0A841T7B7_9BACL|nr:YlbF family regulator [Cohnella lubricantis]MBB6677224.1 YlbF family regulator [Cohnella lubricantis]
MTEHLPDTAAPGSAEAGESADFASLMMRAYELGEMIKQSALTAEYVYLKEQVSQDDDVRKLAQDFAKAKERFAECERFGRFHPDYNEALDRVYELEARMDAIEPVRQFKQAEQAVDLLLHEVSLMIARAVSDTIKVPDNNPNPKGCGSGGSCSCGGGGCG